MGWMRPPSGDDTLNFWARVFGFSDKKGWSLQKKVAIVTGATSGIGEAVAKRFAKDGMSVVLAGRNLERGDAVRSAILQSGGSVEFVPCDVTREQDLRKLVERTMELFGGVDVLFNNAGVFFTAPLEETTSEMWDEAFTVNTKSYFTLSKLCLPSLVASGRGVIINNASVAGMQSYSSGRSYAYSASKAAVVQLSRVLALNYGKHGVRVNTICPGIIETPLFQGRDLSSSIAKIPLGRLGAPEDVSSLASFLASPESGFITGATIPVDGGLIL